MSRCARDILTLSLGVEASPASSANIFIFSLKESCSGMGCAVLRACCSARRRARGSLYTSCAPMTPGVCAGGAALGDTPADDGLASMDSASSINRSGSSLCSCSCSGGGEEAGGEGGEGGLHPRSSNDTRLSRATLDGDSGAGAETGAGAGTGATSTWRVRSAITANEEPRGGAGGGGGAGDALIDSDITPALTEPTDVTSSLIVTVSVVVVWYSLVSSVRVLVLRMDLGGCGDGCRGASMQDSGDERSSSPPPSVVPPSSWSCCVARSSKSRSSCSARSCWLCAADRAAPSATRCAIVASLRARAAARRTSACRSRSSRCQGLAGYRALPDCRSSSGCIFIICGGC